MKTKLPFAAIAALGLFATLACTTSPTPAAPAPAATTAAEPAAAAPAPAPAAAPATPPAAHIKVQHILIAFAGKVPGKNVTRTQDEARALANQILERARKGEDFDELVRTYTDDRAPGIYGLANSGVTPAPGEFSRDRMVPAFGNVGFTLAPGEIGMAEYSMATSPYGWHIIKRLE
jgi:parvulin-like peptidyl-prolyl cis-trans isomerase-like protein